MTLSRRLQKNIKAYEDLSSQLEERYPGQFALFNDGRFIDVYESRSDARKIGGEKFGSGKFSLKRIGSRPRSQGIETLNMNAALKKENQ